jgi:hypothetical protein
MRNRASFLNLSIPNVFCALRVISSCHISSGGLDRPYSGRPPCRELVAILEGAQIITRTEFGWASSNSIR